MLTTREVYSDFVETEQTNKVLTSSLYHYTPVTHVWYWIMGLCFKLQYRDNTKISIKNPKDLNKRSTVRHKPHSTFRPTHSIRPWGFPRKDRYSSHCNCFSPQPPHGSTSTLADHQTPKTTMDTRRDTL